MLSQGGSRGWRQGTVVSLFLLPPVSRAQVNEQMHRGESHGLGIRKRQPSEVDGKSCGGSKRSRFLGVGCLAQGAWRCNVTSFRDTDTQRGDWSHLSAHT